MLAALKVVATPFSKKLPVRGSPDPKGACAGSKSVATPVNVTGLLKCIVRSSPVDLIGDSGNAGVGSDAEAAEVWLQIVMHAGNGRGRYPLSAD